MKRNTRLLVVVGLTVGMTLAGIRFAGAQGRESWGPRPSDADMERGVRETLTRMVAAFDSGDAEALRAVLYTSQRWGGNTLSQRLGLDALIRCVGAQRELEAAAREAFGEAGAAAFAADMRFSDEERKAMAAAPVEFVDNEAWVSLGPSVAPLQLRRSPRDGTWRVVMRALQNLFDDGGNRAPEPASRARIDYMNQVADVVRRVAAGVRAREIATVAAARDAVEAGLAETRAARRRAAAAR